jgi:uncharacterized protein YybS (DUF2232 family)
MPDAGVGERFAGRDWLQAILITGAVLSFPLILPGALGGLHSLIPLPVFYYLIRAGRRQGALIVAGALLLTAAFSVSLGVSWYIAIPVALAPLGYILARAAQKNESPLWAGLSGILFLGGLVLAFGLFQLLFGQGNPYTALVGSMEHGLDTAREFYQKSTELPPETLKEIETIFAGLKKLLPKVLPALLATTVLGTVWINLVVGNWLLQRGTGEAPWPPYHRWRLPEALIWGVILAGAAMLPPAPLLNLLGLNLLLSLGLLYFFQGLAVLAFLLGRWSAPWPLRAAIYFLLFFQVYGILMVTILGLVDIWADFRNRKPKTNHPK